MRRGFLLFEFLLSFLLGSFIALFGARFAVVMVENSRSLIRDSTRFMSLLHASWFLERTLSCSPRDASSWRRLDRDDIIWCSRSGDYSFCLQGGQLKFISGMYDSKREEWQGKPSRNVVLTNVQKLEFIFHVKDNVLYGISYELVIENEAIQVDVRMMSKEEISCDWSYGVV